MNFIQVQSYDELNGMISGIDTAYLLLIKKGSEISDCALKNITEVKNDDARLFVADVARVHDIHDKFGIKTVPALLAFEGGCFKMWLKGVIILVFINRFLNIPVMEMLMRPVSHQ